MNAFADEICRRSCVCILQPETAFASAGFSGHFLWAAGRSPACLANASGKNRLKTRRFPLKVIFSPGNFPGAATPDESLAACDPCPAVDFRGRGDDCHKKNPLRRRSCCLVIARVCLVDRRGDSLSIFSGRERRGVQFFRRNAPRGKGMCSAGGAKRSPGRFFSKKLQKNAFSP